jgi:hypothetical protein
MRKLKKRIITVLPWLLKITGSFIVLAIVTEINVRAQNMITVTGEVTAFKTYPVNKAFVKSLKTGETVYTDSIGRFSINSPVSDVLLISASGFNDKKVRVKKSADMVINLQYGYKETSFDDAVNNDQIKRWTLEQALKEHPKKGQKDYSRYNSIFELISSEILNVKVVGTNVYTTKAQSFSMSPQVLYDVDDMIISDISFISPSQVQKIEYLEGNDASAYGMRGANGVIKITLKNR